MTKTKIPYQNTGYFSKLISDYLEGKEALKPFYNEFPSIDSFQKTIERRREHIVDREALVKSLQHQNLNYDVSEATNKNISLLKDGNTFTVTTGHQLNLFTGPLYFIYKIVSTINLAKKLKEKYPENEFVPVYWMATEDHDFEEVNHFNLFKKKYQLANSKKGAVGKFRLEGVDELLSALKEDLGDRNGVEEILTLFSRYYKSSSTYAQAIKGLVNELFGKFGLVVVDGDDKLLKSLFVDEFRAELLNRTNHEKINATSEKLRELGFKAQVTPREINIFYIKDNLRERIVFEDGKYAVLNTDLQFSEEEIILALENNPEYFSPNAPMRCMYQEKILPNLAYIGGGGELAYWFQLKDMFSSNKIFYPILLLRNSALLVDKGSAKKCSKLEFELTELFKETELIIKSYLRGGAKIQLELRGEEDSIQTVFKELEDKAKAVDASLVPLVGAELKKSLKAIKMIEGRLLKSEKKKEEVSVQQIRNLKEKLFPNNSLQERHDNLISVLLFYGMDVVDDLMENLDPLEQEFTILTA